MGFLAFLVDNVLIVLHFLKIFSYFLLFIFVYYSWSIMFFTETYLCGLLSGICRMTSKCFATGSRWYKLELYFYINCHPVWVFVLPSCSSNLFFTRHSSPTYFHIPFSQIKINGSSLISIYLSFIAFFVAGGMAFFHGAEYLEKRKITDSIDGGKIMFYQSWADVS